MLVALRVMVETDAHLALWSAQLLQGLTWAKGWWQETTAVAALAWGAGLDGVLLAYNPLPVAASPSHYIRVSITHTLYLQPREW